MTDPTDLVAALREAANLIESLTASPPHRKPVSEPRDLLKIPEVAEMVGVPEATLRFWRSDGRGPKSVKVGRRVVYRRSDVQAWLNEHWGDEA